MHLKSIFLIAFLVINVIGLPIKLSFAQSLNFIKLPKNFKISYYATNINNARSLTISPSGIVYVGNRTSQGSVYALLDTNGNKQANKVIIIKSGLNSPNGVAFLNGDLYVSEIDRVLLFEKIEKKIETAMDGDNIDASYSVLYDNFPSDRAHGWKFIRFGPDNKLYVPVGAPCNICEPNPQKYSGIFSLYVTKKSKTIDAKKIYAKKIYAKGIRNTVGFDWHPIRKELWFTDNGRDWLGDDLPPDELNYAPQSGMHFGYPYLHGKDLKDPKYGHKYKAHHQKEHITGAAFEFQAHTAPLGMRFYTQKTFPTKYHDQIFVAQHGSWNRSNKIGYRLVCVFLNKSGTKALKREIFASGWVDSNDAIRGRPVDVDVMVDGSLLVSDDYHNAVYRISYQK